MRDLWKKQGRACAMCASTWYELGWGLSAGPAPAQLSGRSMGWGQPLRDAYAQCVRPRAWPFGVVARKRDVRARVFPLNVTGTRTRTVRVRVG